MYKPFFLFVYHHRVQYRSNLSYSYWYPYLWHTKIFHDDIVVMGCVFIFYVVMIWDDTRKKMVYEISFHSPVLSVRIRKDKYVQICVYTI